MGSVEKGASLMVLPSCLFDPSSPLVLDASVVINLNATGCAAQILTAIPNRIVVTDIVADELDSGRAKGRTDADQLELLVSGLQIERVALSSIAEGHFLDLVAGSGASTLDDGEAATVAWAVAHGGIPIIDDKKGIAICRNKFSFLMIGSTTDLFYQREVREAVNDFELAEALYFALSIARMRVPDHQLAWVVSIIGQERAATCHSLPERARNGFFATVK